MAFLRSSTIQELFYHAQLLSLGNDLLCYVLASVTSFISIRADIPPPVWVRQPETPGMTDRVDCVDLGLKYAVTPETLASFGLHRSA